MKNLIAVCLTVALFACGAEKKKENKENTEDKKVENTTVNNAEDQNNLLNEIAELEKAQFSIENQSKLAEKLSEFIQKFPNEPAKEGLMLKVVSAYQSLAENAGSSKYYSKSVAYAQDALREFPEHIDKKMLLIIKSSIEDFDLKNDEAAIKSYQLLIDSYPNDTVGVANWKNRIENIDKTMEEIILMNQN